MLECTFADRPACPANLPPTSALGMDTAAKNLRSSIRGDSTRAMLDASRCGQAVTASRTTPEGRDAGIKLS